MLRSLANATSTPLPRSGRLLLASASSRGTEGRCAGAGEGGLRDGRVLLPVGEAVQGVGVRRFGVIDSVQNKIISRNTAKQGRLVLAACLVCLSVCPSACLLYDILVIFAVCWCAVHCMTFTSFMSVFEEVRGVVSERGERERGKGKGWEGGAMHGRGGGGGTKS